jgi:hypothetical protein
MKRVLQKASARCDKNIGSIIFIFLFFVLGLNLSGQKIQTMLNETWTSGNWVKSNQITYTYDVNGNTLTSLSQTWDVPSLSWKDQARSNYSNNSDGTANIVTSQTWNGSTWNDVSRKTYTYNSSKKVTTEVTEMWLVAIWQNFSRQTNSYDGSGYLTNSLSQSWDMISSTWKNIMQTNYTNNSNGYPTVEITQMWDGVSAWVNSTRSTYTYNGSKVLTEVQDKWVSGSWQSDSRQTITYDGSGYMINALSQIWDAGSSSYKNDTQSNYTNNPNGTPSVTTNQEWDGVSVWVNTDRITYTYSTPTYNSESTKEEDFIIYPNPADNVITIKANISVSGSTYSISDQRGRKILEGKLMEETTSVDITTLTNGIYFLNIGERNQRTFKIIKQD